jgi:hypothetical protein
MEKLARPEVKVPTFVARRLDQSAERPAHTELSSAMEIEGRGVRHGGALERDGAVRG